MPNNPAVNPNYASLTFPPAWGKGEAPVLTLGQLDPLPSPSTQFYGRGTLLTLNPATGNYRIYDHTAASGPLLFLQGILWGATTDNYANTGTGFNYLIAIAERPSTEWLYTGLNGANAGTADVDYLLTLTPPKGAKFPDYQYIPGSATYFVKFGLIATGVA
jgi:hypothetical protein